MSYVRVSGSAIQFTEEVDDQQIVDAIAQHHGLTLVDLSEQFDATDACIKQIADHCPLLETLYLDGTQVTERAVEYVIESCPDVKRIIMPDGEAYTRL